MLKNEEAMIGTIQWMLAVAVHPKKNYNVLNVSPRYSRNMQKEHIPTIQMGMKNEPNIAGGSRSSGSIIPPFLSNKGSREYLAYIAKPK